MYAQMKLWLAFSSVTYFSTSDVSVGQQIEAIIKDNSVKASEQYTSVETQQEKVGFQLESRVATVLKAAVIIGLRLAHTCNISSWSLRRIHIWAV